MPEMERAAAALSGVSSVAVISHVNPEGDAIGTILAVAQSLRAAGKRAAAFNADPLPPWLAYLPGAGEIRRARPAAEGYACYLVVDTSDLERTGGMVEGCAADALLVNVDHHPGNARFGQINWVDPAASSAGEMLYRLLRHAELPIPPDAATNLYAAIFTDTGGFRFGNTTPQTLRVAAELLECGAATADVTQRLYGHRDLREWRLLAEALAGMQRSADGRMAWIEVTRAAQARAGVGLEVTDDFIQYPRHLHGVELAVAFKELDGGEIRVSFRSNGSLDVAALAGRFGGGGHRNAAGCTIREALAQARAVVLPAAEAALAGR